jgi:hypothetical protein
MLFFLIVKGLKNIMFFFITFPKKNKITIDKVKFCIGILVLLITSPTAHAEVQASNYSEFWLWGGVRPSSHVLNQAKTLYILQGRITERHDKVKFEKQAFSPAKLKKLPVFLVYRLEILHWNSTIHNCVLKQIRAWEQRGNQIAGVQLDFDAHTKLLNEYELFLRYLRSLIPSQYKISITGLLDWSNNGDPEVLESLKDVVEEVIFQTYQGRRTIQNYDAYLQSLVKLRIPFKIGLVESGQWNRQYEDLLANSDYYRGVVVFLLPY